MRAQDHPLEYVLSNFRFQVPDFQRPYSWGEEQQEDLWEDLVAESAETTGMHFMGTMVLEVHPDSPRSVWVWDGQQRIASIVILLSVIRDYLLANGAAGSNELARDAHQYVQRTSPILGTSEPSLRLGNTDQGTFEGFVLKQFGEEGKRTLNFYDGLTRRVRKADWSPKIVECYRYFREKLESLTGAPDSLDVGGRQRLLNLLQTLLGKFELIVARADDADDAFRTFQVLNDRGLGLSAADLLKNFFLSGTVDGQDRQDAADRWDEMAQSIGGDSLPTYLRHFYMARYGLVSRPRLYKTMLRLTQATETEPAVISPQELLNNVTDSASFYLRLVQPSGYPESWGTPDPLESLQVLEGLRATQWTPMLLAAMMIGASADQVSQLIKAAEVLVLREVIVGGRNPNAFEKIFASNAQLLWTTGRGGEQVQVAAVESVLKALADQQSSDELFEANFRELSLGSRGARVVLDALERTLQRQELGGVRPDHQVLDVEHIYPKTAREGWPQSQAPGYATPGERSLLGNLTLLHLTANRSQKNAPFSAKQPRFAASQLLLTQRLARDELPDWTLVEILARQKELLSLALVRWPRLI